VRNPVSYPQLLARVRALVRRSRGRSVPLRRIGALEVDAVQRRATVAAEPVPVSRMEFEFLARIATDPTRVYTKHELLRDVWGVRDKWPRNFRSSKCQHLTFAAGKIPGRPRALGEDGHERWDLHREPGRTPSSPGRLQQVREHYRVHLDRRR
jgi:hypothetical protein